MKKVLCRSLVLALGLALVASAAFAKRTGGYASYQREVTTSSEVLPTDRAPELGVRVAAAPLDTTVLYTQTFDSGGSCNQAGWVKTDDRLQVGQFWHVDTFAGANVDPLDAYAPLIGTKSLWCGARFVAVGGVCGYLTLPGYGNGWNQSWRTKNCIAVAGDLNVSFTMQLDSEVGYDATVLEWTADCTGPFYTGWEELDGGVGIWDDVQAAFAHVDAYPGVSNPAKIRLRFFADGGFSDEDALWDSHTGPVIIDNLQVEGLALETFEDEAQLAETSQDWEGANDPGFGIHMALFSGLNLLQQDQCAKNLTCQWAAIQGSTENYGCGGFPLQTAVPKGNADGVYLANSVESPAFAMAGLGSVINIAFTVYRDMALDGLVFYTWDVASTNVAGCQSAWRSRGFVYYGDQKDYLVSTFAVGDLVYPDAVSMKARFGVIDMCGVWCPGATPEPVGSGDCHSHAPLLDKMRVYRVEQFGPVWSTRDIDMFQDTFPFDGSDTGIGRADCAQDIVANSPTILPGDSARVIVNDPLEATPANLQGLQPDNLGLASGRAMYIWVNVEDNGAFNPAKSGAALTNGNPYFFKDVQAGNWTRIQCWRRLNAASTFVIDLNDNLFEAGDVVRFFFAATNISGITNYASGSNLGFITSSLQEAKDNASEFTILPLNGNGTQPNDVLYVDGMDGRGGQGFFDTAFEQIDYNPDRYDVRGPSSGVGNRPSTRVTDVTQQINANYRKITWDTGDLETNLGDGTGTPEASNDYLLLNTFLSNLASPGGVYLAGDDLPSSLATAGGQSAIDFRSTYITYNVTTENHRPTYGIAPIGTGTGAGTAFVSDTWVIYGGCALINDFDVMQPTGSSVMQSTYGTNTGVNGAEISQVTGNARVLLGGYSFIYIRDNETDGTLDRALHMHDILTFLQNDPDQPTGTPTASLSNELKQNYPNPFNPQTTISFSIKDRARVKIDVYNVAGELVKTLLDETRAAGNYSDVRWDGTNGANQPVSSGVYFYKLVSNNFTQTKKMVLLK